MTVHILTIGDELLIGQVIDTNSARMAQFLNQIGAQVIQKTTVGDTRESILQALQTATQQADVTLVTGGLGPTKDDITKKVLAEFFGTGFVFHQETWERIVAMFEKFGRPVTDSLRERCFMLQNAEILTNKMGTAPGMWFDENGKVLVAMPGVPFEMEYLMEHEIIPRLQQRFGADPIAYRTLLTSGEGESFIAEKLRMFEDSLPAFIKLAYLPSICQVRLRLTASLADKNLMLDTLEEKFLEMQSLLPAHLIAGFDRETLEVVLGKKLTAMKLTIATAESCTGGHLAHLITLVPGSSAYFLGSVICYSNEVKMKQLNVQEATLKEFGAVSEQTVREMVSGTLNLLNTDLAVATSGIAGPGGGSPEKPVGTVWVAVGNKERTLTKKLQLGKDRLRNIQYTSLYALNMVRIFLLEQEVA